MTETSFAYRLTRWVLEHPAMTRMKAPLNITVILTDANGVVQATNSFDKLTEEDVKEFQEFFSKLKY